MKGKRIRRARKKEIQRQKPYDNKVRENCKVCGKKLPEYSKHHAKCHDCWKKYQKENGNIAMIKGVK